MFSRIKQRVWGRSPVPPHFQKKGVLHLSSFQVSVLLPLPLEWLESSHSSRRKAAAVDLEDKLGVGFGPPTSPLAGTEMSEQASGLTDCVPRCLIFVLSLS